MRKFFVCLLTLVISFSLYACGNKKDISEITESQNATPEITVSESVETQASTEELISEEEKADALDETASSESSEAKSVEEVASETADTGAMEEAASEQETESEEPEESVQYTFADMDAKKYAMSSVNVRSLPDISGEKLGGLSVNEEIHITGQCNETGWFRFDYKDNVGFVSDSFIVDEKVEIAEVQTQSNNGFIDGIPAVIWGDGAGNPSNAMGYLATLGYDFDTIHTDSNGKNYYFVLCCTTRDGGGGYSAHLIGNGSVTQERINGSLRIYINNVQYSVERVTSY